YGTVHLSLLLAERGGSARAEEALRLATWVLAQASFAGAWLAWVARCSLAAIHSAQGEASRAESEARLALEGLKGAPALRPRAFTALIRALLQQGHLAEAVRVAEEG